MALFKKWFGKKEPEGARPEESKPEPPDGERGATDDDGATSTAEAASSSGTEAEPAAEEVATQETAGGDSEAPAEGAATKTEAEPPAAEPEKKSRWSILKRGLSKTRKGLTDLFSFRKALDDEYIDELEATLYAADFGPATVGELIDGERGVRAAWKAKTITETDQVRDYVAGLLKDVLLERDNALARAASGPTVILVAGVNGTGKTTSIAKLSNRLVQEGNRVILAAADTFRAAAVEQLTVWSERLGVELVRGESEADPASVAFQGAERVVETGADYLIVDTAGRLHTQKNLMQELGKICRVLSKKVPDAPHEVLLVLDATTGQNAVNQALSFTEAAQVTGIVLTKLDGTAKGGIVITVNNHLQIPVKFVGVGEQIDDLQAFDAPSFVDALLAPES